MTRRVTYTFDTAEPDSTITQARFWELVAQFELRHWREDGWPCDLQALPGELPNDSTERGGCQQETAVGLLEEPEGDPVAVQCRLGGGFVHITIAARNKESADRVMAWIRKLLPAAPAIPPNPRKIPVVFWFGGKRIQSVRRMLDVPRWADIQANYAPSTRRDVAGLLNDFVPAKGGQLLLFHGSAGTGKTFALRALGSEWRSWCDIDYVIDPDRFLDEGEYLVQVLLARGSSRDDADFLSSMRGLLGVKSQNGEHSDDRAKAGRWRLIVLEDTGELLSADAKERTGQSLSRLLNTVDGMIGQGLRILILVTTNEPIRELHPAVARAGRCAANIEYLPLTAEEASSWLGREVDEPTTIADLFAHREADRGAEYRPWPEPPEEAGLEDKLEGKPSDGEM